jgi:hypothetical protein
VPTPIESVPGAGQARATPILAVKLDRRRSEKEEKDAVVAGSIKRQLLSYGSSHNLKFGPAKGRVSKFPAPRQPKLQTWTKTTHRKPGPSSSLLLARLAGMIV